MKLIVKLIAGLLLLVLLALALSWFYLDRILTESIVRFGPEVTGTEVTLDSASLSPLNGSGSLSGLEVANPEGYETPNAFTLGSIDIQVDTSTLRSDVVVFHHIDVVAPQISYESGKDMDNLQRLQQNILENTGANSGAEDGSSAEGETKVIIERFSLKDGTINVKHRLLGDKDFSIPLPDLVLTDIGRKTNGATVREALGQIFSSITSAAKSAVSGSAVIKEALGRIKDKVTDKIKEIKNIDLEETTKDAKEKVKGLLNGFGS